MCLVEARALKTGTAGCAGGGGKRGRAGEAGRSWLFEPPERGSGQDPASRRALAPWPFPRESMGKRLRMSDTRPVFYVSDGPGITAETIGHSLLTQFADARFRTDRIPFVDSPEPADRMSTRLNSSP